MISRTKLLAALERTRNRSNTLHPSILSSNEIPRADRELLVKTGWLREIIRGWYLLVRPDAPIGDSTVWYAHFWDFLAVYLKTHFQEDYCLSAESSLDILLEKPLTPKQVIVIAKKAGSGAPRVLPYETSILIYSDPRKIPTEKIEKRGLQIMTLPLALCRVSAIYFKKFPLDAEIALRGIKTASDLTKIILKYDSKSAGERLIGAYEFLGLNKMATQIKTQLEQFGMTLHAKNPFVEYSTLLKSTRPLSPYAARIEAMWSQFREPITKLFPKPNKMPKDLSAYFKRIDELYKQDAYHSLSIEGFQVTDELIERVKSNTWDPSHNLQDFEQRNALAARGYYEAFEAVKKTLHHLLKKEVNPGEIIEDQLSLWFQALFAPSVRAGLINESDLLGYRHHRVHIRNSRHVPPAPEAVTDCMETFFNCLKTETHPGARVILGHYIFVFIHPYMDGNGRIGRFLMNAMLAAGGYGWTIVPIERREEYMKSLETAGVENNIVPFTDFIISLMPKP